MCTNYICNIHIGVCQLSILCAQGKQKNQTNPKNFKWKAFSSYAAISEVLQAHEFFFLKSILLWIIFALSLNITKFSQESLNIKHFHHRMLCRNMQLTLYKIFI